ncbi:hypothetical protein K504DRAFT_186829 [Pleomassaria siparia CBS 279.74]|uniref:Uncharacterized protein n=1 Tax=Pleomassaria siparia CBS 279.74 TaxID=1314801 RepID=A0A6G1JR46_9PLEO|nr:hypothetical protein K504DRAFT_186829 [Pleomassaria siparia CBS 279.74]
MGHGSWVMRDLCMQARRGGGGLPRFCERHLCGEEGHSLSLSLSHTHTLTHTLLHTHSYTHTLTHTLLHTHTKTISLSNRHTLWQCMHIAIHGTSREGGILTHLPVHTYIHTQIGTYKNTHTPIRSITATWTSSTYNYYYPTPYGTVHT